MFSAIKNFSSAKNFKFFGKKLPNKNLKVHVKFENRKNERTRKIPDHKKLFEFVVESHGREIVISNLNHKEKTKRNTRREFSCRCVARVQVRDSKKRRRYATRADRLLLRQSVRGIESMTPSASLILLTLRFDRQVTASSANADPKHFRYQKPFF